MRAGWSFDTRIFLTLDLFASGCSAVVSHAPYPEQKQALPKLCGTSTKSCAHNTPSTVSTWTVSTPHTATTAYADDDGQVFRKYPQRDTYLARACDVLLVTLPQLGGAASGVMLQALEYYSRTADLTPKGVFHDMMRPLSEDYDSTLVAKIARVYEEHYRLKV